MTVYIDLCILLNFLVDLLLLLGTNRLSGFPSVLGRLIPAALLGAFYSGFSLVPSLFFLASPLWYLVFLCLVAVIAFGFQKSALRRGALFFLLSMALGGIALALQQSRVEVLLLEALGLLLLTGVSFGNQPLGTRYLPVTVTLPAGSIHFTALVDTGNQLRDPVSGQPVTVVAPREAELLTGLKQEELSHPAEALLRHPGMGLRLIPYCSVGQGCGMLLGCRFSTVEIGSQKGPALLAFAPEGLGSSNMYQALTGGQLC